MDFLIAAIMGLIEGITEWLPVSSTGHLILAERIFLFNQPEEFVSMFRVVIQLGAILAVVVLFFGKLWPIGRRTTRDGEFLMFKMPVLRLWGRVLVGTIPALVLGLLLDDWLDAHLYNYIVVAAMLILYGIFFILVERFPRPVKVRTVQDITLTQALVIGFWQVLAMIPGTSRSGATIVGGMLLGLSRAAVAEFTFYLAIPVMAGASFLKVLKFLLGAGSFTLAQLGILAVGCLVAFLVSLFAIRFLMNYVKKHTFTVFGWYRIALGVLVLLVM